VQLLGDLAAGLAAADHQHAAGREGLGIPESFHVDLEQVGRQRAGPCRPVRTLVGACGEDHAIGAKPARRGPQLEAATGRRSQGEDLDSLPPESDGTRLRPPYSSA
jgi:hypothetical protein